MNREALSEDKILDRGPFAICPRQDRKPQAKPPCLAAAGRAGVGEVALITRGAEPWVGGAPGGGARREAGARRGCQKSLHSLFWLLVLERV